MVFLMVCLLACTEVAETEDEGMKLTNSIETFGQKLIKVISDVCFTFFVLAILVITMIAFG